MGNRRIFVSTPGTIGFASCVATATLTGVTLDPTAYKIGLGTQQRVITQWYDPDRYEVISAGSARFYLSVGDATPAQVVWADVLPGLGRYWLWLLQTLTPTVEPFLSRDWVDLL